MTDSLVTFPGMQFSSELGRRIRQAREQNKLSQTELAEELSVSRTTIGAWEAGDVEVKVHHLRELAMRFGISADCLIFGAATVPVKDRAMCLDCENCAAPGRLF